MLNLINISAWNASDKIALGSCILALLSFAISIISLIISKKSLKISEQQHAERYDGIKIYLIDVYKWKKDNENYISFALNITNNATIPNTISNLYLQLDCHNKNKESLITKLTSSPSVSPIDLRKYSNVFDDPICLQERSAMSGWITFKLPDLFANELRVELYTIIASTTDGKIATVDTHIVNQV